MSADLLPRVAFLAERWGLAEPVVAAVSGGVDSMVLFDVLRRAGFGRMIVAHVNHGLRGSDSDGDEAFVAAISENAGCPCECHRADVAALAREAGESVETCGRRVRREFFAAVAAKHGASVVFTAHHADDQAETVLMNCLRGAGLRGLAGMAPESALGPVTLARPLLGVTRAEILAHAAERGLTWREDATNLAIDAVRNRMRHVILPQLSEMAGRDVRLPLVRLAELASADEAFLSSLAEAWLTAHRRADGSLPAAEFAAQPLALRRRVMRTWLRACGVPDVGHGHVEAALLVACGTAAPARASLPGGRWVRRRQRSIFIDGQP